MLPEIDNEQEVYTIPQHSITVTSRRIVQHIGTSKSNFACKTILLTDVSFCGVVGISNKVLLFAAIFFCGFFLYGFSQGSVQSEPTNPFMISLIVGAVCLIAYALSVKKIIKVASSGGSISFESKSLAKDDLYDFISAMQEAKLVLTRELQAPASQNGG